MTTFSSILDITSFFIGVLVNLLLIAMICFYFKRKIDNLELSQSEQAKVLFQMIQQRSEANAGTNIDPLSMIDDNMLKQLETTDNDENDDSKVNNESTNDDSDESDNSDDSDDSDDSDEEETPEENETHEDNETKTIEYKEEEEPSDFTKMTVKELRVYLENKGVLLGSSHIKKQELINLVTTAALNNETPSMSSVVKVLDNKEDETSQNTVNDVTEIIDSVVDVIENKESVELETTEISDINEIN